MPTRSQIQVTGTVQGVGFRPFVWQRAVALDLTGWVQNQTQGVTIEVQGDTERVRQFVDALTRNPPPLASIDSLSVREVPRLQESSFQILESMPGEGPSTPISPDISICNDCLRELNDPLDRRYRYPFINCTNCGPRFTIIEDIPYDRPRTTMRAFPMCNACQEEYDDPADRRFHAQPNACGCCGPRIWFFKGRHTAPSSTPGPGSAGGCEDAIAAFLAAIREGSIVAVKGLGGFHLACDATQPQVVQKLRQRKGRIEKPLAVMVRDVEQALTIAEVLPRQADYLTCRERPIVLLPKRHGASQQLAENVAPGNDSIGLMLPYTPLHYLLVQNTPLVMTSGNLSDEPIVRTNREAEERLGSLADGFLMHDREIEVVCDDSVVRCLPRQLLPIRRSRGFAPQPLTLPQPVDEVLAVGGEIKNTFCVTQSNYAYLSQHIGDMGNVETLDALTRSVDHYCRLFRVRPRVVAADMHPGYLSVQWATRFAEARGLSLVRVQHHCAHVAALMAEHGIAADRQMIGCCFDGTGYGLDQAIWGGEFLVGNVTGFDRFAHLTYFRLPGGDASIQRPGRVALSLLQHHDIAWRRDYPCLAGSSEMELAILQKQLERNLNCVWTSSMGRLFDGVAALMGVRQVVNYEAQAAMELEALARWHIDRVDPTRYAFDITTNASVEIGTRSLIGNLVEDVAAGVDRSIMAACFHHAVARMVNQVCRLARDATGIGDVGLTGGVFQNALLLQLAEDALLASGFQVSTHRLVPANDGGIALGQAWTASQGRKP